MARRNSLLSVLLSPSPKKRRGGIMCGPGGSSSGHPGRRGTFGRAKRRKTSKWF